MSQSTPPKTMMLTNSDGYIQQSIETQSRASSFFGFMMKPIKRHSQENEQSKETTEESRSQEEQLLQELSQLKDEHESTVNLLNYKLEQRENCIKHLEQAMQVHQEETSMQVQDLQVRLNQRRTSIITLEAALEAQQETIAKFQDEIQSLKEMLKDEDVEEKKSDDDEQTTATEITSFSSDEFSVVSSHNHNRNEIEEITGIHQLSQNDQEQIQQLMRNMGQRSGVVQMRNSFSQQARNTRSNKFYTTARTMPNRRTCAMNSIRIRY